MLAKWEVHVVLESGSTERRRKWSGSGKGRRRESGLGSIKAPGWEVKNEYITKICTKN
jgi:hypothetical protein